MGGKWLIGGAVALAVLIAASIAVALTETVEELEEGTPERTVQLYLKAVDEADFKAAHNLLSDELKEVCTVELMAGRNTFRAKQLSDSRITLEDTTHLDGTAIVTVRVTTVRGDGPFGTSESSYEQRFAVAEVGGEWRLSNDPWPYLGCGNRDLPPAPVRANTPVPAPEPPPSPTPATR